MPGVFLFRSLSVLVSSAVAGRGASVFAGRSRAFESYEFVAVPASIRSPPRWPLLRRCSLSSGGARCSKQRYNFRFRVGIPNALPGLSIDRMMIVIVKAGLLLIA